jgi:hypothetical protein
VGVGSGPTARLLAVSLASSLSGFREVNEVRESVDEGVSISRGYVHRVNVILKMRTLSRHVASVSLPATIADTIAVAPLTNAWRYLWRRVLHVV